MTYGQPFIGTVSDCISMTSSKSGNNLKSIVVLLRNFKLKY
jgi:hypothetical protein